MMEHIATRSPSGSCKEIIAPLHANGTNVSPITVSRRLSNEFGLKSHKPARKPHLTTAMKFQRLNFAKKCDWIVELG